MAKQSGLGQNLYVGGYDLSGDIGSFSKIFGGPKPWECTAIDKFAVERVGVERDGGMSFTSYFNPSTGQAHERFSALPTADVVCSGEIGTTLGSPAVLLVGKQIGYDGKRNADGSLVLDVDMVANGYGLEWGVQLTAGKRTDTTATNGTGVDQTAVSTAFGWQAYLHVFTVTGTSVTVTLQDSADNISFANLAGGAFTAATGITSQRLAGGSTDTVRRYVRAITSGVFTNAVFAVSFVRNLTATAF